MKTDLYDCEIQLQEYNNVKLYKKPLYSLQKNDKSIYIGDYSNLLKIHKRLKILLEYAYLDNKNSDIVFSYTEDKFFIKHKKHNIVINLPNEQVCKLSANIGKFIYSKMVQSGKIKNNNENKQNTSK